MSTLARTPLEADAFLALTRVLQLAVIVLDPDGRIELAAPQAEERLDLQRGSAAGRSLREMVLDPEPFSEYLRSCGRTSSLLPGSFRIGSEAEPRSISCEGARLGGRTRGKPRVVLVLPDEAEDGFKVLQDRLDALAREVQQRREIEREYRQLLEREQVARRRAEETDRLKDEFLALVSHELRTPLNAILSWTQILQMEDHDGRTVDALGRIERNARIQSSLIDELLDTTRVLSNQVELDVRKVVVGDVLAEAVEKVEPQADKKGVELRVTGDLGARAEMDPDRVRQILGHLLKNAVKFNASGGHVDVAVEVDDASARFVVRDDGEGLGPDQLELVFDRFRQADQRSRRKHGGLGLGLAIAKQLVELHGGEIHAESLGVQQGAVFRFSIPRRGADVPSPESLPTADNVPGRTCLEGRRVLVVEDNDDARESLVSFLQLFGAEAAGAPSVAAAVAELESSLPSVIVSDLQMPHQDGYDLLRLVRENGRFQNIPVLALTAHARPEDQERALASGFDEYFAKPVPPADLLRALEAYTSTH